MYNASVPEILDRDDSGHRDRMETNWLLSRDELLTDILKAKDYLASFRNLRTAVIAGVLVFRDRRCVMQYLHVERRWHTVTLKQSLRRPARIVAPAGQGFLTKWW
jgi:hypothetical protein